MQQNSNIDRSKNPIKIVQTCSQTCEKKMICVVCNLPISRLNPYYVQQIKESLGKAYRKHSDFNQIMNDEIKFDFDHMRELNNN